MRNRDNIIRTLTEFFLDLVRTRRKSDPSVIVRPMNQVTGWYCDDRRYFEYAMFAWGKVKELTIQVRGKIPNDRLVKQDAEPALYAMLREREMWSDSVKIYCAMSVEAWLNFYGVVRLGEPVFERQYERLPVEVKLKKLLKLTSASPVSVRKLAGSIAERRNRLVHPKTVEAPYGSSVSTKPEPMPETARQMIDDTVAFFQAFALAVPESRTHLPPDALILTRPIACQ